jgi:hypothetical protein
VFALHVTFPLKSSGFLRVFRRLTSPVSLVSVAVNVSDCPYVDGFAPLVNATLTLVFASAAVTFAEVLAV